MQMEVKIDHKSIKGKSKYNNTLLRKAKFYVMKCNKNTWNYKIKINFLVISRPGQMKHIGLGRLLFIQKWLERTIIYLL